MEPSVNEIHELRCKFFEKLENDHGTNQAYFHQNDLAKVSNSDDWLKRFLVHNDVDMKNALSMLWDTCEWRKDNNVNEINENTLNKEYLEDGNIFIRNRDKDGKSLLVLKCKKHFKGQKDFEELKRLVIYWFERVERKDKGDQISLFFDMADTGLNNLDMEYTKYLINLFKHYYPDFLNYIIIFEMPWILNAAFKIIKGWLPSKAVQKIKFVSKNNLKDFVDPDQALTCWGGLDDYTYTFIPEVLETPTARNDDYKKKVHFADGSPLVEVAPAVFSDIEIDYPVPGSKLRISPSDAVMFSQDGNELSGCLDLLNICDKAVTYKIKTTSPEKFRVRPSCGVLTAGGSVTVTVILQPGLAATTLLRDKFLVMSSFYDDHAHSLPSSADIAELWKTADSKKIDQHRLRCVLSGQSMSSAQNGVLYSTMSHGHLPDTDQKISQILHGLNHLTHCHHQLEGDLRLSCRLQLLTLLVLLIVAGGLFYLIQKLPEFSSTDDSSSGLCYQSIPSPPAHQEF